MTNALYISLYHSKNIIIIAFIPVVRPTEAISGSIARRAPTTTLFEVKCALNNYLSSAPCSGKPKRQPRLSKNLAIIIGNVKYHDYLSSTLGLPLYNKFEYVRWLSLQCLAKFW